MVFMTSIRERFRRLFTAPKPIGPGNFRYIAPPESPFHYRLHLRIDEKGNGLLVVNASTVLHLNQTATEMAYHLIQGHREAEIVEAMNSRYQIDRNQIETDLKDFRDRIETLITTPDLDPVAYLGFDRIRPFQEAELPYRLDCALTYRLPDGSAPGALLENRVSAELTTDVWKKIITKAWESGIPHMIFTGGEPTLRDDLIMLLEDCEERGIVTGLISASEKLASVDYLNQILLSGLDHLMFVLNPDKPESWQVLDVVLPQDLFTTVHMTITPENSAVISQSIKRLAELKPNGISLTASLPEMFNELNQMRELAADLDLELVWGLPVPYMHKNPVTLEVGEERVLDGAGRAWLYIEPDGDVLPDQNIQHVLGNLDTDSWEDILTVARQEYGTSQVA
jgi:organic radical activating enzyme